MELMIRLIAGGKCAKGEITAPVQVIRPMKWQASNGVPHSYLTPFFPP